MKNQYFGDNRDLFKYDLILHIIQKGAVSYFTFIPMLTPDEPSNISTKREGEQRNRSKAKAGWKNHDLKDFLDKFDDKSKRNIKQLEGFFKKQGFEMTTYGEYFCHLKREEYFREAGKKLSPRSLIFVDPDIGLEIKRSREEHILYSEVKDLYKRMDSGSLLMVFQFIPRKNREEYLREKSENLKGEVGSLPIYISDKQIVFFFLAKDKFLRKSLGNILSYYKDCYPELSIGNIR